MLYLREQKLDVEHSTVFLEIIWPKGGMAILFLPPTCVFTRDRKMKRTRLYLYGLIIEENPKLT